MRDTCAKCGGSFEREAGFYLGSIYFNYGLTALVVAIVYPVLLFNGVMSNNALMASALAFAVLFPIWFFRYARALWLGFDQYCDPRPVEEISGKASGEPDPDVDVEMPTASESSDGSR